MPIGPPSRQDSYIIDPESGAEMTRLIDQHHFIADFIFLSAWGTKQKE